MARHTGSRSRSQRDECQASNTLTTPARTEVGSDMASTTDRRGMRSGAPSVATRVIPSSAQAELDLEAVPKAELEAVQEDEDVMFLEMKPAVKDESDSDVLSAVPSVHPSFSGPNMALKDFGQELKTTLDALADIQARGISHVVSLPELVLVGDQSSGKSSLMSAIAGLSLPRSSGTCTRCPLHIRISKAREWSCRVVLKQDYEFVPPRHGRAITIDDVNQNNKFPPWKKLPVNRQARNEFKTVQDRFDSEELETVLHCAQVAILNPSTDFSYFIPSLKGEAPEETRIQQAQRVEELADRAEAQFSPNTVALEVKGPDLADLNFYDLPGVFLTAKRPEDKFLERVVKNLTCEYIARPNAIILGAVPMNIDAENSYAFKLIRELKAESRCVGVMTKADLLPHDTAASRSWLSMLHEKTHRIGLGYFITSRQEGDLEAQNKREEAFFNRTPMFDPQGSWPEDFEQFRERCGVEKLKAFLSGKLGEEFSKVIPDVKFKVNDRLHHLEQSLKKYPDPPPNPEMEIMRSLSQFSTRVRDALQHQDFKSRWDRECAEPFKGNILSLKPRFNVSEPNPNVLEHPRGNFVDLSGIDSPPHPQTQTQTRKRQLQGRGGTPVTPSKRPRGESDLKVEDLTPASSYTFPRSGSVVSWQPSPAQPGGPPRSKDLLTVRKIIKQHATLGQPGTVSPSVHEPLYTESARLWITDLNNYVTVTFGMLEFEVAKILEASFQTLKTRAVYKECQEHMKDFIAHHEEQLRSQLFLLYNLEAKQIFTKDGDALRRNNASERRILERHRYHCRMAARNGTALGPIPKVEKMSEDELAKEALIMQKDLKTLGPDPYEQEVGVAVYVRGYYVTAANRFIDLACIHFISGMLPEIADLIEKEKYLDEKLGLSPSGAKEIIARLVSEDDDKATKREELKSEKKRLDEALSIIDRLIEKNLETRPATPRTGNGYANAPGPNLSALYQLNSNGSASRVNGHSISQRSASVTQAGLRDGR